MTFAIYIWEFSHSRAVTVFWLFLTQLSSESSAVFKESWNYMLQLVTWIVFFGILIPFVPMVPSFSLGIVIAIKRHISLIFQIRLPTHREVLVMWIPMLNSLSFALRFLALAIYCIVTICEPVKECVCSVVISYSCLTKITYIIRKMLNKLR